MNNDTFLLRHVHRNFIQAGVPTRQVFRPTPKDEKRLSVYDGDMILPTDAYDHYTKELKQSSAGIVAVTFGECASENLSILEDRAPFPEHVSIDFSEIRSNNKIDKIALKLKNYANKRGWLYGPIFEK